MRSVILYTLARIALFGATAGVLYIVGARGVLLLALAILISGIVSFVLLSRQRDAVSVSVTERAARMRENLAAGAAREDDDVAADRTESAAGGAALDEAADDAVPDPESGSHAEPGAAEEKDEGQQRA